MNYVGRVSPPNLPVPPEGALYWDYVNGNLYGSQPGSGVWAPIGGADIGVEQSLVSVAGNYAPTAANYKVLVSASGTVTLNSSLPAGTTFVIKNTSASGTVVVQPTSGLIDDQPSFSMTSGFGQLPSIEVTFDGTNWWIF
jgi:hypothetical protein